MSGGVCIRNLKPGDPRVNIQMGEAGKAKAYQVREVLRALDKLGESR